MDYNGIRRRTNNLTSDRLARSRSRSNATLLDEIGRYNSKLEVHDRIQNEANHLKSQPMSPTRPRGERLSYNKALGDVVIARSISVGSENCSPAHAENKERTMRLLSSSIYSRR